LLHPSGTFESNILFIVQVTHIRRSVFRLLSRSATFPAELEEFLNLYLNNNKPTGL
jgi:hypothetical protein